MSEVVHCCKPCYNRVVVDKFLSICEMNYIAVCVFITPRIDSVDEFVGISDNILFAALYALVVNKRGNIHAHLTEHFLLRNRYSAVAFIRCLIACYQIGNFGINFTPRSVLLFIIGKTFRVIKRFVYGSNILRNTVAEFYLPYGCNRLAKTAHNNAR